MKLSKNFTLDEMTHSDYALRNNISNEPSEKVISNLRTLCLDVLQPLRDKLNQAIVITSGYRGAELNRLIGGTPSSQHLLGQAADIIVPNMTPEQVLAEIMDLKLNFDQAIIEFDRWLHISHISTILNRNQKLRAHKNETGKTVYSNL